MIGHCSHGVTADSNSTGVVLRQQVGLCDHLWLYSVLDMPWNIDANSSCSLLWFVVIGMIQHSL